MSETRQPTFGGAFRSLRKDLDDMNRDTRKRYLDSACRDDKDYPSGIQAVEERIIEAVNKLQVQSLFAHMTKGHRFTNTFSNHWKILQDMTSKWKEWSSAWKEHVEQRGDLIASREWKKDEGILIDLHDAFMNSVPRGFEKDVEWTEDYHVVSGLIAGIQSLSTDADSQNTQRPTSSNMPPPALTPVASDSLKPTFRFFFRRLLHDLQDLIDSTKLEGEFGSMSISDETLENIQKKEVEIKVSVNRLYVDTLFSHMVSGTWPKDHRYFKDKWNAFIEVGLTWDDSKAPRFDTLEQQYNRDRLVGFMSVGKKAEPKGLEGHPAWTEDYCAASCLATTKPPCILRSEETWAHFRGIKFERLNKYTYEESVNITFGGAWSRLVHDLKAMKREIEPSVMGCFGPRDSDYWCRVCDLDHRIIQSVQKMPSHPLFQHMSIGLVHHLDSKEEFVVHWDKLVILAKKWEYSAPIWTHTMQDLMDGRYWQKDYNIMAGLRLEEGAPRGFESSPEWTKKSLLATELMKADWFQGDKT